MDKREACRTCAGSGCKPGTRAETCGYCRGSGQVGRTQGFFTVRSTCPQCHGQGQTIPHPCEECRGAGQVRVRKQVTVKIPPGVDTGSRLRLTGEGQAGTYGAPGGDLYVFIQVKPHDFFERNNSDIVCRVPISFIQAALGATVSVPTLNGDKSLDIPKGTQPGDIFRLAGEGIPFLRGGGRGDQIIQVLVKTPTHLTRKQESLLREFSRLEEGKLTKRLKNILRGHAAKAAN